MRQEDDIRQAIRDIVKKRRKGDAKPLTTFVDVYAFDDPEGAVVSKDGGCDLVLASANHGPEYVIEVRYTASMVNGAIELFGSPDGIIALGAAPQDYESYLNWRECEMRACLPRQRDECRCSWTAPELQREWTNTTVTKHVTGDF